MFTRCLSGTYNYHMCLNPLTPKISLVIPPTFCHTLDVKLVWRIWTWINQ